MTNKNTTITMPKKIKINSYFCSLKPNEIKSN